jgi:septal ring factor EnvC (AmiA/AmiB activator)
MKLNEATVALVATVGSGLAATCGVSWMIQGRLTSIETKVEAKSEIITGISQKVDKVSDDVGNQKLALELLKQDVKNLQHPLENTQANVRGLIRQVENLKTGSEVTGSYNHGPYSINE